MSCLFSFASVPPRDSGMMWSISSKSPSLKYSSHQRHFPCCLLRRLPMAFVVSRCSPFLVAQLIQSPSYGLLLFCSFVCLFIFILSCFQYRYLLSLVANIQPSVFSTLYV